MSLLLRALRVLRGCRFSCVAVGGISELGRLGGAVKKEAVFGLMRLEASVLDFD